MATQQKIKVRSSAEEADFARELVMPNPGDVLIAVVSAWSFFCFFLVIGGKRLLVQLARMAKSQAMRDAFLAADVQALGALMIGGSIIIVVAILLIYRYPKGFFGVFAFGLQFGNASWKPLHDVAVIFKYLSVLCIGAIGVFFLYKNFWRLLATPYLRLWLVHLIWAAIICQGLGGKSSDIWYLGSDFVLIIGVAIAWFGTYAKTSEDLFDFYRVLGWTCLIICFFHLLAPVLSAQAIYNSRFQSYTIRATMFAMVFTPVVITLFWMSMIAKEPIVRQIFTAGALIGFVLILWSGTRSAIIVSLMAVGILWWVFRTRILFLLLGLAFFGLILQIVASGNTDLATIADRLQSADTGRTELWAYYLPIALDSPVYGYAVSGVQAAVVGEGLSSFLSSVGVSARLDGFHNAYLAMLMQFGGIGLGIMLLLLVLAMRRARAVLTSDYIPVHEKKIYVLPAAMIFVIALLGMVEDIISATGKGTYVGLMYFTSVIICELHGKRLLEQYVPKKVVAVSRLSAATAAD